MIHLSGFCFRTTDKCQSSSQLHLWKHFLHIFFNANAVLNQHHQCILFQQRWQQFWEQVIVHRLQSHQHHITLRHILCAPIGIHILQMETPIAWIHQQSVLLHKIIIPMEKEMHFLPRLCQLRPIIATNGTCSYNSVSHFFNKYGRQSYTQFTNQPNHMRKSFFRSTIKVKNSFFLCIVLTYA